MEAGPGWGKTTAVRAAFPNAQYLEVPAGANPGAFHRALLQLYGLSAPDAGSIVARLSVNPDDVTRSVLAAIPPRSWLVLDDVQRLDADGTHLIEAIVAAQDANVALVGRSMAAFPVGSWMSRGLVGMPFGPDTLALRSAQIADMFGDAATHELTTTIVSAFGGWPIAASLAVSMLRRGLAPERVLQQLGDGIGTVAGSALADLAAAERAQLVAAALGGAYGIAPTAEQLRLARRLGFPESATGLHEVIAAAVLKATAPGERGEVAAAMTPVQADPASVFALLATESPEALAQRSWELLAPLFDRYDRATLERLAAHPAAPAGARAAARCFVLTFASSYDDAAALAESAIDEAARKAPACAVRLARSMAYTSRGSNAVAVLSSLETAEPEVAVYRDCLRGYLLGQREVLAEAMRAAMRSGDPLLVATSAVHAALLAARENALDEAEGLAARGEDAARAGGSVLLEARALKIRFVTAALRAKIDLAAVHVGRLIALQELIGDPMERASDIVAAFEVEVFAGRAARAAAYDETLRKIGPDWLGMETYAVCRSIADAWSGQLLPASDRLAAFASAAPPHMQRLPLALGAFLSCAGGALERGADLLRQYGSPGMSSIDAFATAHSEMAASFGAMAEALLGRTTAAAARIAAEPTTAVGGLFVRAARQFVAHHDIGGYAETMRQAGYAGIAMLADACGLERRRTPLSPAERSVLSYLASGMDAAHIANLTGRSLHTIKNQRRSLIGKLGAGNTLEAVAVARRLGLL